MAKKKKRGEAFVEGERPVPEGEWDEYRLARDEFKEPGAADPQQVDRAPESYDQSVGGGEAGLSESTRAISGGPEGDEPAAKFDFPDEDSGFETHSRIGDEAGMVPFGSENWTRQEYESLAEDARSREEDELTEVPTQGTPTKDISKAALGDTPAYSYSDEGVARDYGRFYTDEKDAPVKGYTDESRSDEEIFREITERLETEPDVHIADLMVEVHNGDVTLHGKVDSKLPHYLVSTIVEQVSGVRGIHDEIRIAAK